MLIALTENLGEFDTNKTGLHQGIAAKKIRRLVVISKQSPFIVFHHGRQLTQIANHQQLNSAKRLFRPPEPAQCGINSIE